jgi:hypothetical protein
MRDSHLLIGYAAVAGGIYLGIVLLAFSLGVGWRVFQWAAGV